MVYGILLLLVVFSPVEAREIRGLAPGVHVPLSNRGGVARPTLELVVLGRDVGVNFRLGGPREVGA